MYTAHFSIHTYESILNFNNCQRKARRAACRWAERAASTRSAAHFRLLGAVQEGLFLISCFQFNAARPKPVWFWHVGGLDGVHVAVEAATCNEDIYPGELPMGISTLLSRGPCSLSAAHCRPGVEPVRSVATYLSWRSGYHSELYSELQSENRMHYILIYMSFYTIKTSTILLQYTCWLYAVQWYIVQIK